MISSSDRGPHTVSPRTVPSNARPGRTPALRSSAQLTRQRFLFLASLLFATTAVTAQTIDQRHQRLSAGALHSIAEGPAGLIAVGEAGLVLHSRDGKTWETRTFPRSETLTGIAFGRDLYVAVTVTGSIYFSRGGENWSLSSTNTGVRLNAIAFTDRFVAVGENGTILTSTTGTSWEKATSPTSRSLRAVSRGTPGENWFTIVGEAGTWASNYGASWELAPARTSADFEAVAPHRHSYYISSGGSSRDERRFAHAAGSDGRLVTIGHQLSGPTIGPVTTGSLELTSARVRCLVAGPALSVDAWHPSFSNSFVVATRFSVAGDDAGRVFWATEATANDPFPSGWSAIGNTGRAILGGVWSVDHQCFYLVGDNASIHAVGHLRALPPPETGGLANAAVRGFVSPAQGPLIAGLVVPGTKERRVLIRAVGPGLAAFGVSGVLERPQLTVHRDSTLFASATSLSNHPDAALLRDTSAQVGAFALHANDAALLLTLAPGTWTATVTGADSSAGTVLIEAYILP